MGGDARGPERPRERFLRRYRLRRRREYLRVQEGGRKHHVEHFMILLAEQETTRGPSRLGVTVTRKVGNAVARNRIKRLVRDVFRRNRHLLPAGLDVVVIAKRQAASVCHAEVERELVSFFARAGDIRGGARA